MTSGHFHGEASAEPNPDATASTTAATSSSVNTTTIQASGEKIRTFVFTSLDETENSATSDVIEELQIHIPELLQSGYSFYTWPCAPILAWFLWERRDALVGKRILELGSGTALPGILAAKCGARVILSDHCILASSLEHIRSCCTANNLQPGRDINVIGLSWGLLLNSVFNLANNLDLIIAADCFYDPAVFEDIIVTVSFLLERNPTAKFIFTYQERSADWSIEALLKKWKLSAQIINSEDIGKASGVDLLEILAGHTIHLLEITRRNL